MDGNCARPAGCDAADGDRLIVRAPAIVDSLLDIGVLEPDAVLSCCTLPTLELDVVRVIPPVSSRPGTAPVLLSVEDGLLAGAGRFMPLIGVVCPTRPAKRDTSDRGVDSLVSGGDASMATAGSGVLCGARPCVLR